MFIHVCRLDIVITFNYCVILSSIFPVSMIKSLQPQAIELKSSRKATSRNQCSHVFTIHCQFLFIIRMTLTPPHVTALDLFWIGSRITWGAMASHGDRSMGSAEVPHLPLCNIHIKIYNHMDICENIRYLYI